VILVKKKTPIWHSIYLPRSCASCPPNNLADTLLTAIVVDRIKLVILSHFKLQSFYPKEISIQQQPSLIQLNGAATWIKLRHNVGICLFVDRPLAIKKEIITKAAKPTNKLLNY
jgi:hypothetical protein